MKHAKLLDCTLRDGAYLIDKKFGDEVIRGIIEGLVKARIDLIEIGFFQDDGFGEGKTVYLNSADAARFVPEDKQGCMFTVLADCSRYSVSNLDECRPDSIDAVRECFFRHELPEALEACRAIKEKGYKLFVQPVDILGYSDKELIGLIESVNELEPYCLSIVDTFGSMYQEDLHRIFELVNHNLNPSCKIGFHSHNNMQMSSALSQEFVRLTAGKRNCIVDGTINGMGRGAGNTPTELICQYLVSRLGYHYDINPILDIIDAYMDNMRTRCTWGYDTAYFLAGCYSAHVNNIAYLTKKNSISSKDIGLILNKVGAQARKRYHYDLLEETYLDVVNSVVDDTQAMAQLRSELSGRPVLVLVPGSSASLMIEKVEAYVEEKSPVVISVNFIHDSIESDFVYMSNMRRYQFWSQSEKFKRARKILASNLDATDDEGALVVSAVKLIKCGWEHLDNSTLMLLRLLDSLGVQDVAIAGFDGYDVEKSGAGNYATPSLELSSTFEEANALNIEIAEMLTDFWEGKKTQGMKIEFVTPSRFSRCIEGNE